MLVKTYKNNTWTSKNPKKIQRGPARAPNVTSSNPRNLEFFTARHQHHSRGIFLKQLLLSHEMLIPEFYGDQGIFCC